MKRKNESGFKAMAINLDKDPDTYLEEIKNRQLKAASAGKSSRKWIGVAVIGFIIYKKFI